MKGQGTVVGDVSIQGTVAPGDSPGTLSVDNITLTDTSTLEFLLASASEYSRLVSSGIVTINSGATLTLTLDDGYVPANSTTFDLIDATSISGTFGTTNLPTLGVGQSWNTDNLYTSGEVTVIPEPTTLLLLGAGLVGVLARRKGRKSR